MEAHRIEVDEIKQRLARGEKFMFLDCRNAEAWGESDETVPNALRVDSHNVEPSLARVPEAATIVTYCT